MLHCSSWDRTLRLPMSLHTLCHVAALVQLEHQAHVSPCVDSGMYLDDARVLQNQKRMYLPSDRCDWHPCSVHHLDCVALARAALLPTLIDHAECTSAQLLPKHVLL